MPKSRGPRLAVREARLITKELRLLGVPPQAIAKIWGVVIVIPLILILNCQKRLFIGIGTELLLKATYLKHGFSINRVKQAGAPPFPFTFSAISGFSQKLDDTYMLGDLIDKLHVVIPAGGLPSVSRGLRIAKVFRNKEGHVVLSAHKFVSANYRDIEAALVALYLHAFQQTLQVKFSVGPNETALWKIR